MLAGAGNETTGRLIGWLGKVLGDHPDQRRQIAADPSLIPSTVEKTLRYEPTGPHVARYVARDVGSYWEVDDENPRLAPTSTVRGWDISGRQDDTAAELGTAVVPCTCDVSVESDVEAMFAGALDAFGRVDAVLNVAGIGSFGMVAELGIDEYERVLNVNLKGVLLGTKHGINAMLPTGGGSIVNWSSIGGLGASPGTGAYSAAKTGVISFTKSAAVEYGSRGIRANAVCPGFVETELTGGPGSGARFPQLIEASALKRAGQPEEVAELASFLASDRAGFISSAVIAIDGGTTARVG